MSDSTLSPKPGLPDLGAWFTSALKSLASDNWRDSKTRRADTVDQYSKTCKDWIDEGRRADIDQTLTLIQLCSVLPKGRGALVDRLFARYSVTLIETSSEETVSACGCALDAGLVAAITKEHKGLPSPNVISDDPQKSSVWSSGRFEENIYISLQSETPLIVVAADLAQIPDAAKAASTLTVSLPRLDVDQICHLYTCLKSPVWQHQLHALRRRIPADLSLSHVSMSDLAVAMRQTSPTAVAHHLCRSAGEKKSATDNPMALDDVKGLGETRGMLEQCARDIASWRAGDLEWGAIPHGLLLSGPPGTGKTYCAERFASAAGAHFVPTSYSDWQKHGHMGQMLAAMRKDFQDAQDNAPSILFIDEIDSFGDRATVTGDNAEYVRAVVNGLLEMLDGSQKTEGVFVVAACNHVDKLDSALVRSGRFDLKVKLPLPDKAALQGILRDHLPTELGRLDLGEYAARLVGQSGADVAATVRLAHSHARRHARTLTEADLNAAISETAPSIDTSNLTRVAIHEAGHALVGYSLGRGLPQRMRVGPAGGQVIFDPISPCPTLSDLNTELATLLAGRVAEEMLVGDPSAGAGGSEDSDLARATLLAARIEVSFGLGGGSLVWRDVSAANLPLVLADKAVANRIEQHIQSAHAQAAEIVRCKESEIRQLSDALVEERELTSSDIAVFLGSGEKVEVDARPTSGPASALSPHAEAS
ncbi:AAA family ATPase [Shimia biformata]|uniref:AAA family ATPase n=1 Tax=Shimia biformata TaxID=1294299 RepID=UPI001952041B|nr:AAA family ATPase [Shimia biformata]